MDISLDANDLLAQLDDFVKNLPKEIKTVNNRSANRLKKPMSVPITRELAIPQKAIKKLINHRTVPGRLSAELTLEKTKRIPISDFRHREMKSGGVSYKISKTKGRKRIRDAFKVTKREGKVYARTSSSRYPIRMLRGPSPWGVFVSKRANMDDLKTEGERRLLYELRERVRYRMKQTFGKIKSTKNRDRNSR